MKKSLILCLALVFSLPFISKANDAANMDIGAMLLGGNMPIFSTLPDDQKAQIVEEAAKEGTEVIFNDDGTTTFKAKDGTEVTQKPDGTMSYKDEQGKEGDVGMGKWIDNELTRLVPKPEMTIGAATMEGETFAVLFANATIEQIKTYAEKVKEAGFIVNAETTDQQLGNMVVYSYTASHENGAKVELFSAMGATGMTLEKTK